MKKLLSVFCATAIAFCCMTHTVFAGDFENDGGISPYSLYTSTNTSKLSISSKRATCTSNVSAQSTSATIYITQTFQKKSGSTWTNISKSSKMFYSSSAEYTKTYSSISSGSYRMVTEATVYVSSKSEKTTSSDTASC